MKTGVHVWRQENGMGLVGRCICGDDEKTINLGEVFTLIKQEDESDQDFFQRLVKEAKKHDLIGLEIKD
jgi:hypothetical protein